MPFDGETYDPKLDKKRLAPQQVLIREFMLKGTGPGFTNGKWYTAGEIAHALGLRLTAGTSARIRDLRKTRFGGYNVERRRRGPVEDGLWEYRINGLVAAEQVSEPEPLPPSPAPEPAPNWSEEPRQLDLPVWGDD